MLECFFAGFSSQEDFEGILSPALARGILRSPELVLNGNLLAYETHVVDIIPFLTAALRPDVDFSKGISDHLLPQLLSSLKSTNSSIRDASQQASKLLIARCRTPELLRGIAEALHKALKDGKHILVPQLISRAIRGYTCGNCSSSRGAS